MSKFFKTECGKIQRFKLEFDKNMKNQNQALELVNNPGYDKPDMVFLYSEPIVRDNDFKTKLIAANSPLDLQIEYKQIS